MHIYNRNKIIISIGLFTALTAIGAYIKIPLPYIPVTLQTFFVIMSGNLLGFRYGSISQVSYLGIGLIGIPIFAYGGGPGYIFQPSFGYLMGYPFAAFVIGMLLRFNFSATKNSDQKQHRVFFKIMFADLLGVLVIFITGLCYLYLNIKYNLYSKIDSAAFAGLNFKHALSTVVLIFLPVDCLKVILATWVTMKLKRHAIISFVEY